MIESGLGWVFCVENFLASRPNMARPLRIEYGGAFYHLT